MLHALWNDFWTWFNKLGPNMRLALWIVIITTAWMLTGLIQVNIFSGEKENIAPPKSVAVVELTEQPYRHIIRLIGQTEPEHRVRLVAQTAGQITTTFIDTGTPVAAGSIIAQLDPAARPATLAAAESRAKSAMLLVKAARALAAQGFRAQTDLAAREAELAQAEQALAIAQKDMADSIFTSPITGMVERRYVNAGDYVRVGDVVADVVNRDKVLLVGYAAQNDVAEIQVGQVATAVLANGQTATGTVRAVATMADDKTRTYRVEILVLENAPDIPTNMTADIQIPTREARAHKIPHAAIVLADDGKVGAMQAKRISDTTVADFIPLSLLDDDQTGIWVQGLPSTISLVVRGQTGLIPGEAVSATTITNPQASAEE